MGFEFNGGNFSGVEFSKLSFLAPPANPLVDSVESLNWFEAVERHYQSSGMNLDLDSISSRLHLPNFNESSSGLKYVAPYCNGGLWEPERTNLVQLDEDRSLPSSSIHTGPFSLKRSKTHDKTDFHVPLASLVLDDAPKNMFRPKSGISFADVSPDEVKKALDSLDSFIARDRFLESFEPHSVHQLVKKSETINDSNCKDRQNRSISTLIDGMYNLSRLILCYCSNGTCELSKQDLRSLEKVRNNIDICTSMNFEQELFDELRQGINMGCMQVEAIEISSQKPEDALDKDEKSSFKFFAVCNQNPVGTIDAEGDSSSELDDAYKSATGLNDSSISDQSSQDLLSKKFEEQLSIEDFLQGITDSFGSSEPDNDKLTAELNDSSISDQSSLNSSGITSDWDRLSDESSDWEYVSMEEHFY